jgi:hypothetical protein
MDHAYEAYIWDMKVQVKAVCAGAVPQDPYGGLVAVDVVLVPVRPQGKLPDLPNVRRAELQFRQHAHVRAGERLQRQRADHQLPPVFQFRRALPPPL